MIKSQSIQTIFLKSWHPYIWIALLSFLLYGHVIFFSEYTHYDDHFLIVDNYSKIDELSDIWQQFREDVGHQSQGGSLYRPILNISIILGTQISGTELWGHFLINILLHAGSCMFLFVMLLNLGVSRTLSFTLSIIFTIHPALTQSIAWISGRNDSLLAFFILLTFISFLKFTSSSSPKWYCVHLLFFAFSLFTKETTIIFPFLILFYYFVVLKDKVNTAQITAILAAWMVVCVNWYILREAAQITQIADHSRVVRNLFSDLWIIIFYLGKIFWPVDLTFGPLQPDINLVPGILSALFLLGMVVFSENRNWKIISFGILWFGVMLIPTFIYHTNKVDYHIPYYEHRIYVPMIGIFILLSSLTFTKKMRLVKTLIPYGAGILIVFLVWKSYSQTFHFQNFITLRQYSAESSPHDRWLYSTMERMSLPSSLMSQIHSFQIPLNASAIDVETNDSAKNCIRTRSILETLENRFKKDPSNKELVHSLAIVNYARGLFVRAEELFLFAKRIDPQNADIPYNYGIFNYDAHRPQKSEKEWLLSVKLNPSYGNAYLNLSYLYYEQCKFEEAWTNCQSALKHGITVPISFIKEIEKKVSGTRKEW